ncbi:putative Mce family protein [Nocardia neocaledoniensis NBRC 108232]|uniref:Phospholipid/cholesterol/gamma-HCH transport system substrate-binding protein n=1 Tax=Nocardia neocaledoniensis TaxID=236511 RepID=A0A317N3T3_9NOCA|nr:MlaD family protein [Nocardia neocaledoniensis]PWV69925.1 phospholipid/cholesterol/gamma-HCH transport system substrate-binding protein [Nocardia neocaledoniensis]GEM31119.1 putative Mce family protein [Nocardia neocaledoniensis NBRC 108232]
MSPIALRAFGFRRPTRDPRAGDLRWGIAGICAAVVLLVGIGAVYVTGTSPERAYSADLTQAGSVRPGDDVRLAGIPVGKVTALTLLADRVRMDFTVAADAFLGDQTTLDIRMLTFVGGYYVAVLPAGTRPLGDAVIPRERVIVPYNLTQAFQDAVEPVRRIDGSTVRRDLAAMSTSIEKSPDAVRSAVRAAGDLVGLLDEQNADISRTLAIADEYLTALDANADVLAKLLITLGTLEQIIQTNKVQVAQSLRDLAVVLRDFTPLGRAWDASLKQRAQPLADAIPALEQLGGRLGALLDAVRALQQRVAPLLAPGGGIDVDQSGATIPAPSVCIPLPGGGC